MPDDFRVSITDAAGKDAYPISGFTYLLVYKDEARGDKGKELVRVPRVGDEGRAEAREPLHYAPLPKALVKKVEAKLKSTSKVRAVSADASCMRKRRRDCSRSALSRIPGRAASVQGAGVQSRCKRQRRRSRSTRGHRAHRRRPSAGYVGRARRAGAAALVGVSPRARRGRRSASSAGASSAARPGTRCRRSSARCRDLRHGRVVAARGC